MRHLYISSHSRNGYVSFFPKLAKTYETVIVLTSLSRLQAGDVLKTYVKKLSAKSETLDLFYDPSDGETLEAFAWPRKKLLVASGEMLKQVKESYPNVRVEFIHFSRAMKEEAVFTFRKQVQQLERERDYQLSLAYEQFKEAKQFHETKEKIYLHAMDFNKADEVANELIEKLFSRLPAKKRSQQLKTEQFFFGAATKKGAVNFIDSLTKEMKQRIIIKGRSGSGKSHLMNTIAKKAKEYELDVSYFHCAFDPNSVDMVMIEQISTALVDGMPPHIVLPKRKGDVVIDMFDCCIDANVERLKRKEIAYCEKQYAEKMRVGTKYLQKAAEAERVIAEYMTLMLDEERLQQLSDEAFSKMIESKLSDNESDS